MCSAGGGIKHPHSGHRMLLCSALVSGERAVSRRTRIRASIFYYFITASISARRREGSLDADTREDVVRESTVDDTTAGILHSAPGSHEVSVVSLSGMCVKDTTAPSAVFRRATYHIATPTATNASATIVHMSHRLDDVLHFDALGHGSHFVSHSAVSAEEPHEPT